MRDEVRHEAQISLSGLDKEVTLYSDSCHKG